MSVLESRNIEGMLDELMQWSSADRLRLARMILKTLEPQGLGTPPREGSLKDLVGALKTNALPPNDDECRAILEEELIKKHLK